MQEKLIIYLHANDLTEPSWAVLNGDGTVRQSAYRDAASGLAQIAEDKIIIVIVPQEEVLLTSAQLPKMPRSRLLQAVPYALEDELIAEVDTLHFALGENTSDHLPIAVVAHEKMRQWLDVLNTWNIKPDVMIPAAFALPHTENVWHVAMHEMAIVRMGVMRGFACDKKNLAVILEAANASASLPSVLRINHYAFETANDTLSMTLPIAIEEDASKAEDMINDFAQDVDVAAINLLQGVYAVKKSKLPQMNKIWRITSGLAIAWVLLLFLYPAVSYFVLKQRLSTINSQMAQIYKRHFPQANSLVAPKIRMQEKLQNLNEAMGENRVLLLLGYLGKAANTTSNIKFNRLDFQNGQLTLELTAATSEDFSAFTDYLNQQGLNVKQQNANLNGARINATLLVE